MILSLARGAAVELRQTPRSRGHVALGMIREGQGVAATALQLQGIVLDRVLLALLRETDSPIARLFARDGLTYDVAKAHVHTILGTTPPSTAAVG